MPFLSSSWAQEGVCSFILCVALGHIPFPLEAVIDGLRTMTSMSEMKRFLDLQPLEVTDHVRVVTPEDTGASYLLHISRDGGLTEFVPRVSKRTAKGENRSVARISVAPSLIGCVLGYCSDLDDFFSERMVREGKSNPNLFRGGWYIYGIRYDQALRPDKSLVPDVEVTDEHWLVTSDEATKAYPAQLVGKFFYNFVKYIPGSGTRRQTEVDLAIEVCSGVMLNFNGRVKFQKGFYRARIQGLHTATRYDRLRREELEEIDELEYLESKNLVASLLGHQEVPPPSSRW